MGKIKLKTAKILTDRCSILALPDGKDRYGQRSGDLVELAADIPCRLLPVKTRHYERTDDARTAGAVYTVYIMPWPSYADQRLTIHNWLLINGKQYDIVQPPVEPVLEGLPTELTVELVSP